MNIIKSWEYLQEGKAEKYILLSKNRISYIRIVIGDVIKYVCLLIIPL